MTASTIHPLLAQRRSPYQFDPTRSVSQADLSALFEAARWAMSAFNAQPWRYIVGVREVDADRWQQVLDCLVPGNQSWAQHVPVLALGLMHSEFEHNAKPNQWAMHDLGAASAHLTVEAAHRGLAVHQMAGIEPDKVIAAFELPDGLIPVTALAIGYAGPNPQLDPDIAARETKPRERKTLESILWAGRLG